MAAKKILVADDSLTIQKVIRLALSNEGYEIQAVSDGNDALEQISTWRPDVVLVDVSLPNRSAFELKRALNEHADLTHVKFVLMSSAFESVDEVQAAEVHFVGRLTKPFDPAHLRQILAQALSQEAAAATPPHAPVPPKSKRPVSSTAPILTPPPPPSESIYDPIPTEASPDEAITPPMSDFTAAHLASIPGMDLGGETDIRELTESTIKMSGLDDFEWSIQEPSLKPLPNLLDTEGAYSPDPPLSTQPPSSRPQRSAPSAFDYVPPPLPEETPEPSGRLELDPYVEREEPTLRVTLPPKAAAAPAPDAAQMDEMIRHHVERALEKFAREVLPDVAERVIKQEIHRLLSEQP